MLFPLLAGIGALCMSNPGKRRRRKAQRKNPGKRLSFEQAKARFTNRFTMEHVPSWTRQSFREQGGTGAGADLYPAPQFRSDREWYDNTIFPGEPGNRSRKFCETSGQTWPLGLKLSKPYSRNPRRRKSRRK